MERVADGSLLAEYTYDTNNRRRTKRVFDAAGTTVVKHERYIYDGWNVIEVKDELSAGATILSYVYGLGIDDQVQFQRTAAHPLGAGTFYVHQTTGGNVSAITDATGTVLEKRFYDDYGRPLNEQKQATQLSTVGNEYGFQGRRYDSETGLYYFLNRMYDAETGRFLQRDPVWDPGNVGNQYTFCGKNSPNCVDPMGTDWLSLNDHCFLNYGFHREVQELSNEGVARNVRSTVSKLRKTRALNNSVKAVSRFSVFRKLASSAWRVSRSKIGSVVSKIASKGALAGAFLGVAAKKVASKAALPLALADAANDIYRIGWTVYKSVSVNFQTSSILQESMRLDAEIQMIKQRLAKKKPCPNDDDEEERKKMRQVIIMGGGRAPGMPLWPPSSKGFYTANVSWEADPDLLSLSETGPGQFEFPTARTSQFDEYFGERLPARNQGRCKDNNIDGLLRIHRFNNSAIDFESDEQGWN